MTDYSSYSPANTVLFWRPQNANGHYSQWSEHSFTVDGILYHTAEHWMMRQKALLFGDTAIAAKIVADPSPREARTSGRLVSGFKPATWEAECIRIVREGNIHKYGQNEAIGAAMRRDYDDGKLLVEASPSDAIWGIGFEERNAWTDKNRGKWGTNFLGRALMQAREELFGTDAKPYKS